MSCGNGGLRPSGVRLSDGTCQSVQLFDAGWVCAAAAGRGGGSPLQGGEESSVSGRGTQVCMA